jgi:hypothetical protein
MLARRPVFDPKAETPFDVIRRVRAQDLPKLPAEWGTLIAELIPKCWDYDLSKRPSFEDIFRLVQANSFGILPGGNAEEIGEYCQSILSWEARNPGSR